MAQKGPTEKERGENDMDKMEEVHREENKKRNRHSRWGNFH
jgi:hypothetical protein